MLIFFFFWRRRPESPHKKKNYKEFINNIWETKKNFQQVLKNIKFELWTQAYFISKCFGLAEKKWWLTLENHQIDSKKNT